MTKTSDTPTEGYTPLTPSRPKVTDQIIETMRQDIATGKVARGERLPNERDLAKHFGVSQPTIREAVRVLDAMGLIDVRHGSGAYATGDGGKLVATSLGTLLQLERVGIIEVLEVRTALGRYTARRAVHVATPGEIAALEEMADVLELVGGEKKVAPIAEKVVQFQCAMSAAAHNPLQFAIESFLIRLLVKFQLTAKKKAGIRFWRDWTLQLSDDRRRLVTAIRDRDEEAAVTAMAKYLAEQYLLFSSDADFKKLRLSDPAAVNAIAGIMGEVPSFDV